MRIFSFITLYVILATTEGLQRILDDLAATNEVPHRSHWRLFRKFCSHRRNQRECSDIMRYFRRNAIPIEFPHKEQTLLGWREVAIGGAGKDRKGIVSSFRDQPEQFGDDTGMIGNDFIILSDGVSSDPASDYFSWQLVKFVAAGLPRIKRHRRVDREIYRLLHLFQRIISKLRFPGCATLTIVVTLDDRLIVASLGDSEVKVIRGSQVIFRSVKQRRRQIPGQLSARHRGLRDIRIDEIYTHKGDVVIAATDGLWDNVLEKNVVKATIKSPKNMEILTKTLTRTTLNAIQLGDQECTFQSHDQRTRCAGGIRDDITIVTARI